ncbi:MAG: enoyl-CoA hydratase/isomerase family protein [Gemmatimonadetes bacterium]|nr:enoyl-CoA hydratase/isomerase family protein [Gemmatimonadota bacterium]
MPYESILVETSDAVATVTVNRPEKLNALNATVRRELVEALDGLAADDDIRAVLLIGAGDKAFVAGADVAEFAARTPLEQRDVIAGRRVYDAAAAFPKPLIAVIRGYCLGGGCELALACDLRVAGRSARFGQPEIRLGLVPGGGGTQRLARLVGYGQALRLAVTGDFIDAEDAYRIGLVEFLVDDDRAYETAREIARRMTRWSPVALRLAKEAVQAALETPLSAGLRLERELFLTAFASEDGREGVRAFMEKREPRFTGR